VQSVSTLELEHYPGMTEKAIEAMIDAAHARFTFYTARASIHRVGPAAAAGPDRAGGGDVGASGRGVRRPASS
jgi:hypothetical protein